MGTTAIMFSYAGLGKTQNFILNTESVLLFLIGSSQQGKNYGETLCSDKEVSLPLSVDGHLNRVRETQCLC